MPQTGYAFSHTGLACFLIYLAPFYKLRYSDTAMTKTITFHPKLGLRIPAKILREAGFQPKRAFVIKINTHIINLIPECYEAGEEKDWLDEALETPEGKAYFQERVEEVEREYREGKTRPIEELFKELGV